MSRPARIYMMGGLWGFMWPFYYSNGLKDFVRKAERFGNVSSLVLSYGEADIQRVVSDAAFAVTMTPALQLVIGGHSLGVRAAVEAVRRLWMRKPHQVKTSLVIGFDGTWNAPPAPVPDDIPAIEFYNTTASALGHSKMFREDGSERGIRNIPLAVMHQNIDDNIEAQNTALAEIKKLLA
jgi:hypothetical protein